MSGNGVDSNRDIDFDRWVGRQQVRTDILQQSTVARLAATLNQSFRPEDWAVHNQRLAHWLCFLPDELQGKLGPDGHPIKGDFLPPVDHLPRRMWAGSRLEFSQPLPFDQPIVRQSKILSVVEKQGRNGPLVFVTVGHQISTEDGEMLLSEAHDVVYRSPAGSTSQESQFEPTRPGAWQEQMVPDEALLFRYSALTFNTHRIHYDYPYVTGVEGYPGLVVHGPLIATLLMDLIAQNAPERKVRSFEFRAVSPMFCGDRLHLDASLPDQDGNIELWASNHQRRLAMSARAVLAPTDNPS